MKNLTGKSLHACRPCLRSSLSRFAKPQLLHSSRRHCRVQHYLDAKRKDHASVVYLKDLTNRLTVFGKDFTGYIGDITTADLDDWLRGLNGSGRNRNNFRRVIMALFNFAKSRKYLSSNQPTAAIETTLVKSADLPTGIFTPEQMHSMLDAAKPKLLPYLAICGFTGVRTEELVRMEWSDIHFESKCIYLEASKTKTKSNRIITMPDNLIAWLQPYRGQKGKVMTYKNFARTAAASAKKLGIEWVHNGLRHSYGSYRLDIVKSEAELSLEMGNSPAMIIKHYRKPLPPGQAAQWWTIMPQPK